MKILVVGSAWIGDMVMAQALLKLLKRRHPNATIDVLAPAWTYPLLERMPEVHEGILFSADHGRFLLRDRLALAKKLKNHGYDWAIVLPRSLKSALIPWLARARRRTGFLGEMRWGVLNDVRYDWNQYSRTVDRFISLGMEAGESLPETEMPQLTTHLQGGETALRRLGHSRRKGPVLALCPGAAFGPAKRWPVKYFSAVAGKILHKDWEVWLFGSKQEQTLTEEIQKKNSNACLDLAGKLSLTESLDMLALTRGVISNDSGLMHMAASLGLPLVALYGSSDPKKNPPLNPNAKSLFLGLECSPCLQRECPLGHFKCMEELTPERVLETFHHLSL